MVQAHRLGEPPPGKDRAAQPRRIGVRGMGEPGTNAGLNLRTLDATGSVAVAERTQARRESA